MKKIRILLSISLFITLLSFGQEKTITGIVKDATGQALPGANVVVKGTQRGTQTDIDGNYSIKAKQGEVLVFSFVGCVTESITVGAAVTYNVTLKDGPKLEDVTYGPPIPYYRKRALPATTVVPVYEIEKDKKALVFVVNGKAMNYRRFKKIKPERIGYTTFADSATASAYTRKRGVKVVLVQLKNNP